MRPIVTDVPWSVSLLDTITRCAKTAEPIEIMLSGVWTRVGPWKHVLDGAQEKGAILLCLERVTAHSELQ